MPAMRSASLALLAAVLAFLGCGDDGSKFVPFQPPPDTAQARPFVGFLADGDQGAPLEITISPSGAPAAFRSRAPNVPSPTSPAVGILRWPGGDVALTGIVDNNVDTLYLTAPGWELRGERTAWLLLGKATTPSGPAGFMAVQARDSAEVVRAWIGTFRAGATPDSGTICFARYGTSVSGQAFNAGADAAMPFSGDTSTGGNPVISFTGSIPTMFSLSGTGTLQELTGTASGSYTINVTNASYGSSSEGTWSATRR